MNVPDPVKKPHFRWEQRWGEGWGVLRKRGVVAQWYHRADKSATATRDPAPSPAGCGSDFPSCPLSVLLSLRRALTLQQALTQPLHLCAGNIPPHRHNMNDEEAVGRWN